MKLFAVIGNPISHSRSPLLHNTAFGLLKFDACYTRYLLENGGELKKKIVQLGLNGANVTVPFKEYAYTQCDFLDDMSQAIGAVNTVSVKNGQLHGFNTDAPGFMKAIEPFGNIESVLILGAGGTARAVAVALVNAGKKVFVLNRSRQRLSFFDTLGIDTFTPTEFQADVNCSLVVNTTSAGLADDELPFDIELLRSILGGSQYAMDAIYGKKTPFLRLADELSVKCKDGGDMLLWQAFFALEKFYGSELKSSELLIEAMRRSIV